VKLAIVLVSGFTIAVIVMIVAAARAFRRSKTGDAEAMRKVVGEP
jgi:CDP-diacylglycerol pyrophosphatase